MSHSSPSPTMLPEALYPPRFCFSFDKGMCTKTIPSDPPKHDDENHKSIRDNLDIVRQKLSNEKAKRRIAVPFTSGPFPNMYYTRFMKYIRQ